jgi:PLP dependent protein
MSLSAGNAIIKISNTMDDSISYDEFRANADSVMGRIAQSCAACGRDPESVKLMAVTKTHGVWAVEYAQRYGLKCIGENRVQEAEIKREGFSSVGRGIPWELIGSLQSNKAKAAAGLFERVQSVDRAKLARELDKRAGEAGRRLPILLEINSGRDPAKHGAEIEDAPALLEAALACGNLEVQGLMAVAPIGDVASVARGAFEKLRELRDGLEARFGVALPELSMGMSGDLEEGIRAGSTLVRVGTALYGARNYGV